MSLEEAVEVISAAIGAVDSPDEFEKLKEAIDNLNCIWEAWLEDLPLLDES